MFLFRVLFVVYHFIQFRLSSTIIYKEEIRNFRLTFILFKVSYRSKRRLVVQENSLMINYLSCTIQYVRVHTYKVQ